MKCTFLCILFGVCLAFSLAQEADDFDNPEYGEHWDGDIITEGLSRQDLKNLRKTTPLNAIWDPTGRRKWPGGVLRYKISSHYSEYQRERMVAAFNDLVESTKLHGQHCIKILPRTTQRNYVYVQDVTGGCSSYLGMVGGRQRLNLANGCFRHGTIMHEFLHAFGFHHEQKRADRDDYVTIVWSNIRRGKSGNFRKLVLGRSVDHLGTRYDYSSVMHYGAYSFAIDRSKPTIIPHDPNAVIGQRTKLSKLDIERVQIFYGCLRPRDSVYFKHLDDMY